MDDLPALDPAKLFESAFRRKAAAATNEFEGALHDLVGPGTTAERARLRDAARVLMHMVARVLIQME
jgi:hypothetical protein